MIKMYSENEAFKFLLQLVLKYVPPGELKNDLIKATNEKHSKYVLSKLDELGFKPNNQFEQNVIKSAFFYAE